MLAGPAFAWVSNIAPTGLGRLIVERFHLLPLALLLVPLALGLDRLAVLTKSRLARSPLLAVLAAGLAAAAGAQGLHARHRPTVEQFLANGLAALPERAVLLAESDLLFNGYTYLHLGRGQRPDVTLLSVWSLRYDWYRIPSEREIGHPLPAAATPEAIAAMVRAFQAEGREVFASEPTYGLERLPPAVAVTAVPYGTHWRFLRAGEVAPPPAELAQLNDALYAKFNVEPELHGATGWAADVLTRYAATWQTLAEAFDARGDRASAERCRAKAAVFAQ